MNEEGQIVMTMNLRHNHLIAMFTASPTQHHDTIEPQELAKARQPEL